MIRIAITGPESSGKTSLASALAEKLGVVWVPEYARNYLMERGGNYSREDLDKIARGQFESWNMQSDQDFLISDTEMVVMKVWSEFKYGSSSHTINSLLHNQDFDHYFLCRPDIPWEDDPLRENPDQRDQLFTLYVHELESLGVSFSIVEGNLEERIEFCLKVLTDR